MALLSLSMLDLAQKFLVVKSRTQISETEESGHAPEIVRLCLTVASLVIELTISTVASLVLNRIILSVDLKT